jgi:hypothetical protein
MRPRRLNHRAGAGVTTQRRISSHGNECKAELLGISGLDADLVDRILDNRPYRNPLDLVTRMVIPTRIYAEIKHRVHVPREAAAAGVQVG